MHQKIKHTRKIEEIKNPHSRILQAIDLPTTLILSFMKSLRNDILLLSTKASDRK